MAGSHPPFDYNEIESIRKHPVMYIGGTGPFGLIHYFGDAVGLLLAAQPTVISLSILDGSFVLESDAAVEVIEEDGLLYPLEVFKRLGHEASQLVSGPVLTAISKSLDVVICNRETQLQFCYEHGQRTFLTRSDNASDTARCRLTFVLDMSFFPNVDLSPYNFQSYFRRLSYFYSGVRFSIDDGDRHSEFVSPNGVRDLFDSIAAPFQIMHEPICLETTEGDLSLELVLAHQSWKDDHIVSFVNKGRAVEGGTHEDGLKRGLNSYREQLQKRIGEKSVRNGIIAVMSIGYLNVQWKGCIKAKIGNPELPDLIDTAITREASRWLDETPEIVQQIAKLDTFTFPEAWGP